MTDALFSPSSPDPSSHHDWLGLGPDFGLENLVDPSTAESALQDPADELFALFETHFQDSPEDNSLSTLDIEAIAHNLTDNFANNSADSLAAALEAKPPISPETDNT